EMGDRGVDRDLRQRGDRNERIVERRSAEQVARTDAKQLSARQGTQASTQFGWRRLLGDFRAAKKGGAIRARLLPGARRRGPVGAEAYEPTRERGTRPEHASEIVERFGGPRDQRRLAACLDQSLEACE